MQQHALAEPIADGNSTEFATISEAIAEFQAGRFVLIVDDEDRENEGDLAIPAQFCGSAEVNFMAREGRGLICMPMLGKRLDELKIPMMVVRTGHAQSTAFTVSVDARDEITTGISAADRAVTIQRLIDPGTRPEEIVQPGHLFPLRYMEGGVLRRAGHTEASIDLARLAGLYPAAVICEVMAEDGTMARLQYLKAFAARHNIKMITVAQLVGYRRRTETLVKRVVETELPTEFGSFTVMAYESMVSDEHHLAIAKGNLRVGPPPLVRMHSECLTGDVFGSQRCDCGAQLRAAMQRIAEEGRGVIVYLRHHEGRGIGLVPKLQAYNLQDRGMDTVEANVHLGFPPDARDYGLGAQILVDLGLSKIRLLTNNPSKRAGIQGFGLEVVERIPLQASLTPRNERYLRTKREKLGHLLDLASEDPSPLSGETGPTRRRNGP